MYATVNIGGNSKEQFKDSHRLGFGDDENEDIFKIALANISRKLEKGYQIVHRYFLGLFADNDPPQ